MKRRKFIESLGVLGIGWTALAYGEDGNPFAKVAQDQAGTFKSVVKKESPKPIRIPRTATALALLETKSIVKSGGAGIALQRRYVWLPGGTAEEAAVAKLCLNIAVNRSSVDYNPPQVQGGALLPIDLAALVPNPEQYKHTLEVWNSFQTLEPYFTGHIKNLVECPEYLIDGVRYRKKWQHLDLPAPHLGPDAIELEALVGNITPTVCTYVPVVRLDWLLWMALSSIDGSKYLELRGLEVGKTKLNDYLSLRGVGEKFIKETNSDERIGLISTITGRGRGITVEQSEGVRPSIGQGIVAITDDNFADRDDPATNPFFSLLDHHADAHEVILTQSNGWPEYTLWTGDGVLLAEAAANVAADHRIPEPFPRRLNGAISCLRCHGPQEGWKPARNEVKLMLADRGRINTDTSGKGDTLANVNRIASLYLGDLDPALKAARDTFDRRCFAISRLGAKSLTELLANSYNGYVYIAVDAKLALSEIGVEVGQDDLTGVITFRRSCPPLEVKGRVNDDPTFVRLGTDYLDLDAKEQKRVSLTVTRREWELVYADAMDRALPQISKAGQPVK